MFARLYQKGRRYYFTNILLCYYYWGNYNADALLIHTDKFNIHTNIHTKCRYLLILFVLKSTARNARYVEFMRWRNFLFHSPVALKIYPVPVLILYLIPRTRRLYLCSLVLQITSYLTLKFLRM